MNLRLLILRFEILQSRLGRVFVILLVALILAVGFQVAGATPALAVEEDANSQETVNSEENKEEKKEKDILSQGLCKGANLQISDDGGDQDCENEEAGKRLEEIIANILNLFSIIAGIATVVMMVYAGFRYIVGGGDEKGVKSARNTIIYAIIGAVLVLISQIVVEFVLGRISSG